MITACVAATASMLLASVIAWYLVRRATLMARVLSVLSFCPGHPQRHHRTGHPAALHCYSLHGTLLILILAFMTRYLAFTTRVMHAAQLQIDKVWRKQLWCRAPGASVRS